MNTKQKNQAIKLIQADCQISGRYVNGENTCAIGCLALAAGVRRSTLENFNTMGIGSLGGVIAKIQKRFGLTVNELERIQYLNDTTIQVEARRRSILKYLTTLGGAQ